MDKILILDFGGTQAYHTARRLRGERIYCEVLPGDTELDEILRMKPKGLMLLGGDDRRLRSDPLPFDLSKANVPALVFGACARMLGESISAEHQGIQLEKNKDFVQFFECALFDGLSQNDRFFERVDGYKLPEGYEPLASTPSGLMPAFGSEASKIYALQFYVENNDPDGLRILTNFAENICSCQRNWAVENFAPMLIEEAKSSIGNARVLLPVSGGVDTAVTAALLHKAIGNRLSCLFVDTGFLRKDDPGFIRHTFKEEMNLQLIEVDARERFLKALDGKTEAKDKRIALDSEFSSVFAEQYILLGDVECMAEGTIYCDVLKGRSPLVTNMLAGSRRIEPLRTLFKDDVRALGAWLGLGQDLINRPSFDSAGLAVRCLGELTREHLSMLREADAIYREEICKAQLSKRISQYAVYLSLLQTADSAKPRCICVLQALNRPSSGRANAFRLPYDLMELVVQRIRSEIPSFSQVLYDITGHDTAEIEWE